MSIEVKISKKRISYQYAMKFINKRVKKLKHNESNELLWILEHPTTFTAGIRAQKNEILDKKITVINTNRGGKITLHNPGQKIIYFVLNLNNRKKDIKKLINTIEKSIIDFLKIYKIYATKDKKNIGIYVNKNKIAAIGIRVSKWIAYHGCSINISNNLNQYLKIIPCGLDNKKITSIYKIKNKKIKGVEKNLVKVFLSNLKNL